VNDEVQIMASCEYLGLDRLAQDSGYLGRLFDLKSAVNTLDKGIRVSATKLHLKLNLMNSGPSFGSRSPR
jgi:hypothetical protein